MKLTKSQKIQTLERLETLTKRERDLIKQELLNEVQEASRIFVADAANHHDALAELCLQNLMSQLARLALVNGNFKMTENECFDKACIDVVTLLLREMLECKNELIIDACCSKLHNIVCSQSIVKNAFQNAYKPYATKEFLFNTLKKGDKVEILFRILHG